MKHKNHTCGHDISQLKQNEKHDAYFCAECDKWIEKQCGDEGCDFCRSRPQRPSLVTGTGGGG